MNGIAYKIRVDTGVKVTLIPQTQWVAIRARTGATLQPCARRLRPYGTADQPAPPVPILGQTTIDMEATAGAKIRTTILVIEGDSEPLLGEDDAYRLGIVDIHRNGAAEARTSPTNVRSLKGCMKTPPAKIGIEDIPITEPVRRIIAAHPKVFEGLGRIKDANGKQVEIEFGLKEGATPVRQGIRPAPIALRPRLKAWLEQGLKNDTLEGPLQSDDPQD